MLHHFLDKGAWFRAKRTGYGAGLPIAWQGWALIAAYVASLAGISLLTTDATPARVMALMLFLVLTAIFILIVQRRTEGGWRWRWGARATSQSDDDITPPKRRVR